jgi:hypothetical protein
MNTDLIKTGDLLHCEGKSIIAKAIKFFTGSAITHTAVAIRIWDQLYIIDAQRQGVFPRPFGTWLAKYNYAFTVQRSPYNVQEKAFATRAMSKSGSKYDLQLLLLEHPEQITRNKLGMKSGIDGKFERNDSYVCSEFALWCYSVPNPEKYTPVMVKEYCDKNNWLTILRRD